MDFGDFDDFSQDNNPFAGSNHYYSNGILNASTINDNHNTATNSHDTFNDFNNSHIFDSKTNTSHGGLTGSGFLASSQDIFNDNYTTSNDNTTSPAPPKTALDALLAKQSNAGVNNGSSSSSSGGTFVPSVNSQIIRQSSPLHESDKASAAVHNAQAPHINKEVSAVSVVSTVPSLPSLPSIDHDSGIASGEDEVEDSDAGEYTELSISEQPTMYVNPALSLLQNRRSLRFTNDLNLGNGGENEIKVSGFEIIRDFKNVKTVFYKVQLVESSSGNVVVLRRYSDFASLRSFLMKFFQTKVIPPIPEKHSLGKLLKNPFNYKSDTHIIERRIRMLEYFLNELITDDEIRKSEIFNKFLDPGEKNWSSILNAPPFTTLSAKSILLTSPKDPTKPNPYISYLPLPPVGLLKKYNSGLNSKVFVPLEKKVRTLLILIINLENIVKQIIKDFEKNRISLVELGAFYNIFSILENQQQAIEKFGNKIDLTFLNIEFLVQAITVKIKEPLMIIRLTLISILQVLQFRKMKELQLSYLQDLILRKQSRLKNIIDRLSAEIRLNEVLTQSDIQSPSLSKAITDLKIKRSKLPTLQQHNLHDSSLVNFDQSTEETNFIRNFNNDTNLAQQSQQSSWGKAIAGSSSSVSVHSVNLMKQSQKSISKLSMTEINDEILKLHLELNDKLTPCFNSLLDDVQYISVNVENNCNLELTNVFNKLSLIMFHWKNDVFGEFSSSCQKIWANER